MNYIWGKLPEYRNFPQIYGKYLCVDGENVIIGLAISITFAIEGHYEDNKQKRRKKRA